MTENTKVTTVLLNGSWDFALDPERRGIPEKWYLKKLSDQVYLPGTTDSNGKGTGPEKEKFLYGTSLVSEKNMDPGLFFGKTYNAFSGKVPVGHDALGGRWICGERGVSGGTACV